MCKSLSAPVPDHQTPPPCPFIHMQFIFSALIDGKKQAHSALLSLFIYDNMCVFWTRLSVSPSSHELCDSEVIAWHVRTAAGQLLNLHMPVDNNTHLSIHCPLGAKEIRVLGRT